MKKCYIHNTEIKSVFQLLGEKENDMTYSLGWALSQSKSFFDSFLSFFLKNNVDYDDAVIHLQKYEKKGGFTDIEVISNGFHLIIEVKRGWNLPSIEQLTKYEKRLSKNKHGSIITISECSEEYFRYYMDVSNINHKVIHIPWSRIYNLVEKAKNRAKHAEKRLLNQLSKYLRMIMTMQNKESNWVYVVSLGSAIPEGWDISWQDIVNKKNRYFHPISGGGWPNTPPNYMAFRYKGKLQTVHYIERYTVTKYVHDEISEIPKEEWEPRYIYHLGPAMKPLNEVKTGKIYPNGRVWCMLDTLLTSSTISEARDISKKRMEIIEQSDTADG